MSNEFDSWGQWAIEEIEDTLSQLIELGLVEAYGVDENGEFMYRTIKEIEDE